MRGYVGGVGRRSVGPAIPQRVHETLRTPGEALDASVQQALAPRFGGQDFSRVRIHADERAAQSARDVAARAYAYGRHIVFGRGQYAPSTADGSALLTHEVAHVLQRPDEASPPDRIAQADSAVEQQAWRAGRGHAVAPAGAPGELKRDKDPAASALYPTGAENEKIQKVFGPVADSGEPGSAAPPALVDPDKFKDAMNELFTKKDGIVDRLLPSAKATEAAGVKLGEPAIGSLADVAEAAGRTYYAKYISGTLPKDYSLRAHTHLLSPTPGAGEVSIDMRVRDWVDSRMHKYGGELIETHGVVPGSEVEHGRDWSLWNETRQAIIDARKDDLATILKFFGGFHLAGEVFVQPRIAGKPGETDERTQRRGRWEVLQTLVHEMLHAMAHSDFDRAVRRHQNAGIGIEGFAEYFARQVYANLRQDAAMDPKLRRTIEGAEPVEGDNFAPPEPNGYQNYVDAVNQLKQDWAGDPEAKETPARASSIEESLRVAFFMGRVEYIGLGSWTRSEGAKRFPANTIAAAVAIDTSGSVLLRARYGRVLAGRDGALKFDIGPSATYLSSGETTTARVGGGVDLGLRYEWPNVYIGARAGLEVSGQVGAPSGKVNSEDPSSNASKVRVDLLPGIEFKAKLGVIPVSVGVNTTLLIPLGAGSQFPGDKKVRPFVGVGVSGEF